MISFSELVRINRDAHVYHYDIYKGGFWVIYRMTDGGLCTPVYDAFGRMVPGTDSDPGCSVDRHAMDVHVFVAPEKEKITRFEHYEGQDKSWDREYQWDLRAPVMASPLDWSPAGCHGERRSAAPVILKDIPPVHHVVQGCAYFIQDNQFYQIPLTQNRLGIQVRAIKNGLATGAVGAGDITYVATHLKFLGQVVPDVIRERAYQDVCVLIRGWRRQK